MLLFSTEILLLLCLVIFLIGNIIRKKWRFLKDFNIPHDPPSLFTLGNLGDMMKDPDNLFKKDLERKQRFGDVYGYYIGLNPRIAISDPVILKQIYIKEFSNFRERQITFRKINGKEINNGLFHSQGRQWKRMRSTLSPTFSVSKLKGMSGIVDQCVDKMIDNLHRIVEEDSGRFDAAAVFGRLSIDVMCSTAFSANVHAQDSGKSEQPKIMEMSKKLFSGDAFKNPLIFLFMLLPSTEIIAEKLNYSMFGSDVIGYFSRLVDALLANKSLRADDKRVDLMKAMLEAEVSENSVRDGLAKGLTRNEIVGNAMLMLLAGSETTANSMTFLAYNLATHKHVQEKLRREVDETFAQHGKFDYDAVNNMKYLMMCINESARLYPAVPRNSRLCEQSITIGGVHIPAGTHVDIPTYGLMHDDEHWEKPFQFNPERMADMSKIDPMVFQPFGAGPRNCIGMRLAIFEMRFAFCKLLHRFELESCTDTPAPPLPLTFKTSMQSKVDVFLKLVPRSAE